MRALRRLHRWLGLLLAAPLLVQGLSGAFLTVAPMLAEPGGSMNRPGAASPGRILAAARAVAPPGMRPTRYDAPAQVHVAQAGAPRGAGLLLRFDPVTATPLGPATPDTGWFEWVRRLHENWLIPQWGGRQVSGWLGIFLLLLVLLGIPLWWPRGRWRDGFTVPRRARGLVLHRRLHAAAGAWLCAMLLATSVTGIVQGFPQTARALLGLPAGGPPRPGRAANSAPPPTPDLDQALRLALSAAPGTELRTAMLPASEAEPLRLVLAPPQAEGVARSTTVSVDAAATRVLSVARPGDASAGEGVLRWAHDLHFGQGLGPLWRALTALTGLSLPLFAVTGAAMWLSRRQRRRRAARGRAAAAAAE